MGRNERNERRRALRRQHSGGPGSADQEPDHGRAEGDGQWRWRTVAFYAFVVISSVAWVLNHESGGQDPSPDRARDVAEQHGLEVGSVERDHFHLCRKHHTGYSVTGTRDGRGEEVTVCVSRHGGYVR